MRQGGYERVSDAASDLAGEARVHTQLDTRKIAPFGTEMRKLDSLVRPKGFLGPPTVSRCDQGGCTSQLHVSSLDGYTGYSQVSRHTSQMRAQN